MTLRFTILLFFLLGCALAHAQDAYQKELGPMVQQYCASCHGARGRGGVSFSTRGLDGNFVRDSLFWKRCIKVLEERSMPENADRLKFTEIERQRMIGLILKCMRNPDVTKINKDPGPSPLRLLTQYEYKTTIRDLLGAQDLVESKMPGDSYAPGIYDRGEPSSMTSFMLNRYINVAEDILDALPRERIVTVEPSATITKHEAAAQSLKQIQNRAFRRPASDEDLNRTLKLFDEIEQLGRPYDETLRITLSGVLASQKFISHLEQPKRGDGPQPVDAYDLASRLSYFIWSSMPDQELLQLAEQGKLSEPAIIKQQVLRMLADKKSRALADNFAMQWLGLRNVRMKPPTTQAASAPTVTQSQYDAMCEQSVGFLEPIFCQDKSLLSLIDDAKGGVLGFSAMHIATAAGERTSPPRRGRWVLETLLGQRVSPGFYNSCRIAKDVRGPEGPALRTMLETARKDAQCAVCHDRIDPPGLTLEGFDALGVKLAAEGDITPVKQLVLAQKDDFIRNLVERMFGYAIGRAVEPYDQPTVQQICDALAKQDYRSSVLIVEIAQSMPFNYRRPPED